MNGKVNFLLRLADWIEEWSKSPMFTFTAQTSKALITTIRATAALITDLLNKGYGYVLTSKFQIDPLERRYGNLRRMSGGRFLVSLTEVTNSQRILLLTSVIKEEINFWENDLYVDDNQMENIWLAFKNELSNYASEILESCLSKDSKEVSTTISGFIAKKITEKFVCSTCSSLLISETDETIEDEYLKLLSRGGLTVPTSGLSNYVSHAFSALSVAESIIGKFQSLPTRAAANYVLNYYLDGYDNLACSFHLERVKNAAIQCIINIFFNNKQKTDADKPRKDNIEAFKKRQRICS